MRAMKSFFVAIVLLNCVFSLQSLPAYGEILNVCKNGCAYTAIQSAIDSSISGDEIRIAEGTYQEIISLTSSKILTIKGGWNNDFTSRDHGSFATILDARGMGSGVSIIAAGASINIELDGINVKSGQSDIGGGVFIKASGTGSMATVKIKNCEISNCVVSEYGGGISAEAIYDGFIELEFTANAISNNSAGWGGGGGLACNAENFGNISVTMIDNVVDQNTIQGNGAGIYLCANGSGSVLEYDSDGDKIKNNNSTGNSGCGGGLYAWSDSGATIDISIDYNEIMENEVYCNGGGIYIYPSGSSLQLTVSNSIINKNVSWVTGGGFLFNDGGVGPTINMIGNTISKNKSVQEAAGLYFYFASDPSVLNFSDNSILENNLMGANSGFPAGNGICIRNESDSSTTVNFCRNKIWGNYCDFGATNGGGIFVQNVAAMLFHFSNNIISDNSLVGFAGGSSKGGGLYLANTGGTMDFNSVNNTITNNRSVNDSGSGSSQNYGGGIFVTGSGADLSFKNDVIYGNQSPFGPDLYNYMNTADMEISHSDLGDTFGAYTDSGGNISSDPLFPGSYYYCVEGGEKYATSGDCPCWPAYFNCDYSIPDESPCVDAGTSDGAPDIDISGLGRPSGSGHDIGAYEFTSDCDPFKTGLSFFYLMTDAYDATSNGGTIKCRKGTYGGDLSFTADKTVTVKGGYEDCYFESRSGETGVASRITIAKGCAIFENIIIK